MKTEDISLFHTIVNAGSLVNASNQLNIPKSTLSRRLTSLENDIGVKLFHRQNRKMTLTSAGQHFYTNTQKTMANLEQVITDITDDTAELTGHLRIMIFPILALDVLVDTILDFISMHPKLTVDLITTTQPANLIKENIDVAFMIQETFDDGDMVVRKLFSEEIRFVASPEYIARAGSPLTFEDIEKHDSILIRFPQSRTLEKIPVAKDKYVRLKGKVSVNNVQLALMAAIKGHGIAYVPYDHSRDFIEEGKLVPLLMNMEPYRGQYIMVYPSRRFISMATQKFIDYILEVKQQKYPKNFANM